MNLAKTPTLIAHVIYRLDIGGLETVLVNLINTLPEGHYQHIIICLTDASPQFAKRIEEDVEIISLNKQPGQDFGLYIKLWRIFRKLKPAIVQTYNIGTLESLLPAWLAGVKYRIHAEHGRDIHDLKGTNRKYNGLRKVFRPLVTRWIAVSLDLQQWLKGTIGIPEGKTRLIYNGVNPDLYRARPLQPKAGDDFVIGTVGRLQAVKNQKVLLQGLTRLCQDRPDLRKQLRLLIVGEGALFQELQDYARQVGIDDRVEWAGAQDNVPDWLAKMHVFILPSLAEGIAITILEAMASGLPVIATNVGGNPELVTHNKTGLLIPSNQPQAIADSLLSYIEQPQSIIEQGKVGQKRVEEQFSLKQMVGHYHALYDQIITR